MEMKEPFSLSSLAVGEWGRVQSIETRGPMPRRLLDIGLALGAPVRRLLQSPFGDPSAYEIGGAVFALRKEDACQVLVEPSGGTLWS